MEGVQAMERPRSFSKVRTAGLLCAIGGAGWLAIFIVGLVLGQPPSGVAFAISQVFWIVIHSLLLIGIIGLTLSGAAAGWFGGTSLGIALLGRVVFVAGEIRAFTVGEEWVLLPLGALITAVGMTLVGIAVLRAKRWGGWQRFTPLLAGIYPFVVMFPFIVITSELESMLAIAGWGLPWLLLGYAIRSSAREQRTPQSAPVR